MARNIEFLNQLESIIDERLTTQNSSSYVHSLISSGLDRVLKKVAEESGEVIIGSKNGDKDEILNESADLLFHLLLTLKAQQLSIKDVIQILAQRHDQ